jgi:undecaprenyl-diphosphatase
MKSISFIGLPIVVILLAFMIGVVALLKGAPRVAFALAASMATLGLNTVIKNIVDRPRPDTLYVEGMRIHSYSFPSGHTVGSTVLYGLLAYLAYSYLPQPFNIIAALILGLLIFLVGISRVYLGAHFPSDVVAGWLLGGISLILIIKLIKP